MSLSQRMSAHVQTTADSAALFAGNNEQERMTAVRKHITEVREIWSDFSKLEDLKRKMKARLLPLAKTSELESVISDVLDGYCDWADMDYERPVQSIDRNQTWRAIDFYCSDEGYSLCFSIFNAIFREKEIEGDLILVAVALVELVTIELYNLRMRNIGDSYYGNYQGITYRGMSISSEEADDFRRAAMNPDLSKRNFAIPLALISSTTSKEVMERFSNKPDQDRMYWTIHVHGLDPRLAMRYAVKYPESVVTSICAMPVAKVSRHGEKEILLRGPFFHIIRMDSELNNGQKIHNLQVVMMNTNRDHGTEHALNDGDKQDQRAFFADMVRASRYEICAGLARKISAADAQRYERLAREVLQRINAADHSNLNYSENFAGEWSKSSPTWYGDITGDSLPPGQREARSNFAHAVTNGDWTKVKEIVDREYEWQLAEWFNVSVLGEVGFGRTILHEIASKGPPPPDSIHSEAFNYLIQMIDENEVWRTQRATSSGEMAHEIAAHNGFPQLCQLLQPRIYHPLAKDILSSLEKRLHLLLVSSLSNNTKASKSFTLPPLEILTEMKDARLWIPIPFAFEGYLITLQRDTLKINKIVTVKGIIESQRNEFFLSA